MSFLQQLLENHGDAVIGSLARHLELSPEDARQVFARTAPLVLGGLARQAQTRGPEAVAQVLDEHADDAALTDPEVYFQRQSQSGDPLGGLGSLLGGGLLAGKGLGGLFGGGISKLVTGALASFLGVDAPKAAKVLPMLVPLIMAALRRQTGPDGSPDLPAIVEILQAEGDLGALEELAGKVLSGAGPLGGLLRGGL